MRILEGYLDSPSRNSEIHKPVIDVIGWAFEKSGQPLTIRILIDEFRNA